ncbi:hypothetical protein C8A00DRAFT_38231 [Chaetomidium leptoderma]|uniref:Uncharacterized protein n=1 Tax=Chaetomidium leptoderma TaxID=669021 RepID=A0AAN6VE25_9PEZI|nr:hypothetical protein C8A00DRAFT_38231 [Chaetomidium leptoderma]
MAQNNEVLVQTVDDFSRMISRQGAARPALFCFYELKACKVGLIAGMEDDINMPREFIVGEPSATFDAFPKEGLALDHFGMNKFEEEEDGIFHQVRRQLVKMAENSAVIMEQRGLARSHGLEV